MAADGDIIVVTGGNGFVGQHVIKLLHQHCHKEVKEIRVFDIKPYTQNLGKLLLKPLEISSIYHKNSLVLLFEKIFFMTRTVKHLM